MSEPAPSRPAKGASAFRTIGEVADDLDLPAHVLRFWESKFLQLRPLKRAGGRRYYRPEDVALLRRIRQCLYQDGYTIRGVQKLLGIADERPTAPEPAAAPSLFPMDSVKPTDEPRRPLRRRTLAPEARTALEEVRRQLTEARKLLDALLPASKKD